MRMMIKFGSLSFHFMHFLSWMTDKILLKWGRGWVTPINSPNQSPYFSDTLVPCPYNSQCLLGPILRLLGNHLGKLESAWKERLTWNDGYLESSVWRGSFDDCGRAQNKWLFNGNPRALDSACLDPQWQSAFHGQSRGQMWEDKTNDFSMAILGKSSSHAGHFMARQG